jgi:hypothetical protein
MADRNHQTTLSHCCAQAGPQHPVRASFLLILDGFSTEVMLIIWHLKCIPHCILHFPITRDLIYLFHHPNSKFL